MTKDRFRFRAWDKSFQKYYENVIVSTINGEITVYERLANGDTILIPSAHVVLEQCTGLKDKNGRLIYENDVVSCGFPDIGCVKWKNGGFWVSGGNYIMPWHFFIANKWEVLGNIHENPELLEVQK